MKRNLATTLVESFKYGSSSGLFCAIRTPEKYWFIGSGNPNSIPDAHSEQRGVFEIRRFDFEQAAECDSHWGSLPAIISFCPELRPLWREQISESEFPEIRQAFAKISEKKSSFPLARDCELSLESWKSLHAQALSALTATELKKLVISRYRDRSCELTPSEIFSRLLTLVDQESFLFFVRYGDLTFFGLSPESLLRWDRTGVSTHALAGTLPLGQEASAASLLQNAKEMAEHEAVVSGMLQAFCKFKLPTEREAPALKRARGLTHIVSNIRANGSFTNATIQALAESLHPTPATCGFPQVRAKAWLREYEAYDRGWYCGTIGAHDLEGGEKIVALRSAALRAGKLRLFAGAGVVPGSIAENEYQETNAKFGTIEKFIAGDNP